MWHFVKKILQRFAPHFLMQAYFFAWAWAGALWHGHPSRRLRVIGITGTDGKSSTVGFLSQLLRSQGHVVAHTSSVTFNDGKKEWPNVMKMTMPGRFFLQSFISRAVENGCDTIIIEVTSEGIKQQRHRFIHFDVVVVTNMQPEHLESHGGWGRYVETKLRLVEALESSVKKTDIPKLLVLNADDYTARTFRARTTAKTLYYGFHAKDVEVRGVLEKQTFLSTTMSIANSLGPTSFVIKLGGPFAYKNFLAAIATAHSLGYPVHAFSHEVKNLKVIPGRFQYMTSPDKNLHVLIDYAHTVAAVTELLGFAHEYWPGPVIHVFGAAGGGRDSWKRPVIATLSEKYASESILTEENSFDEPLTGIIKEIQAGFSPNAKVKVVPSRRDAVRFACSRATPKSLVLLTGKGCERVIAGAWGNRVAYNEEQVVWQLFNQTK